jgi:hypothetical protein
MNGGAAARARWAAPAHSAQWLAWSLSGAMGAWAYFTLGAHAHVLGAEPICLLRRLAHVACPTCGMTRALALLARGEWRAAIALHPWAPVLAAQAMAAWALWGARMTRPGAPRLDRWIPHVVAVNAAALALLWLVRWLTGALPAV